MDGKKISFGFMKTKKLDKPVVQEKRDYIECVEEKAIKVVGGEEVQEEKPLIIPMKPNTLITAERLKEIAEKVEKSLVEPDEGQIEIKTEIKENSPENETLDQMAVRELLQDAKKDVKVESVALTVSIPAKLVMDGQKESTLEDYESVPVQDYGMAMLRGMGWAPTKEQSKYKQPELRPKGLGLGADKVIKKNQNKHSSKEKDEELSIVKNSFVKITTGKYSGYYGKVVSLDEDTGRVMVDITVKKETVSLGEFMMQPVTKSEYDKESKVINADSYEQYKKNESSQRPRHNDSPKTHERETSASQRNSNINNDKERNNRREESNRGDDYSSNGKTKDTNERHRRDSSSSEDRSKQRRKHKKHRSRDSSSSSDTKKKSKHRSRRRHSSSVSDDWDKKERRHKSEAKRDIDKKRKGKKKKRDRDRSPNYKKHRK